MRLESVSNAPQIYVAPLISAEQSQLAKSIKAAASRAFEWIRAAFRFVFRIKKPVKPAPPRAKVAQAAKKIEAIKKSKPGFFGNLTLRSGISQFFGQNGIPLAVSAYNGIDALVGTLRTASSAFVARKVVDIASNTFAETANLFFPATPYAIKKVTGLVLAGPAVWHAADACGYRQGYMFMFGVVMSTVPLCLQMYGQYQARSQKELERQQLAALFGCSWLGKLVGECLGAFDSVSNEAVLL